jgi:hypothetical protein
MAEIPDSIDDNETIVRVIFSPINVRFAADNKKYVLPNAFRSPAGIDEVSVIRLNHTHINFCKSHGVLNQKPENKRQYFGIATLSVRQIRSVPCDIISTPKKKNPAHADIKIGFIPQKGEPLPAEFKFKIDELSRMSLLYEDENPTSKSWEGPEIKCIN